MDNQSNFPPVDPFADLSDVELCDFGLACLAGIEHIRVEAATKYFELLRKRLQSGQYCHRINLADLPKWQPKTLIGRGFDLWGFDL